MDDKPKSEDVVYSLERMLVRAPGLDDERNKLAAFVATGKSGLVENLIYVHERQFNDELNKPGYLKLTLENGKLFNDF